MTNEQQDINRMKLEKEVFKQLVQDSFKKLLTHLEPPTEEEQTKDARIENLRGINEAYMFRIKEQEAEIENLKDELEALNVAFKVLLKKA